MPIRCTQSPGQQTTRKITGFSGGGISPCVGFLEVTLLE